MARTSIAVFNQEKLVNPFALERSDLHLESIAHSLAMLNRYTGHTIFPYSVAQHSCLLHWHVPKKLKRSALMHDMSESLFNDVANPVKSALPEYRQLERQTQERIYFLLGEPIENLDGISEYDRRICRDEMETLFPKFDPEWFSMKPLGVEIEEWDWRAAKEQYLELLMEYI